MIGFYDELDFERHQKQPRRRAHYFLTALIFLAAYFTTISVHAQQDSMVFDASQKASITGTVKSADENFVIVTSAGRDIKVVLTNVNLKAEADTIFTPGMTVTADGEMKGDDFGMPLMKARTIVATAPTAGAQ